MTNNIRQRSLVLIARFALAVLGSLAVATVQAAQFDVNVVDNDGNPVNGFRWILQEDTTFDVDPTNPADSADPTGNSDGLLSLSFHKSYHPIAKQGGVGLSGNSDTDSATINAPAGRYYVSVLPYAGYSISGQPVRIGQGQQGNDVTVVVQKHPIPTATIAIFLFQDFYPINGAPDLPEEDNPTFLADGTPVDWTQFNVILEEPAGRYGMAGGQVIQDAYGNPLGTTYVQGCDANGQPDFDPTTNYGCFDLDGNPIVLTLGDGTLHPEADGTLLVKNLAPGKYGVIVNPPTPDWQQTTTIEGTRVIDAWVKANEPPFFVEFGPPGPHVFVGFLKKSTVDGINSSFPVLPGGATISGTITDMHMSRPPSFQFFSGRPFPDCWVGVNENVGGLPGPGVWAGPCGDLSDFTVAGLAPGAYQLKVFDTNLDVVIATQAFTVDADVDGNPTGDCNGGLTAGCNFGEVAVFNWFTRLNTGIFNDVNQDGFWDVNGPDGLPDTGDEVEKGIGPESQDVTLRWRDGTMYQNFPTDGEGLAPFDEVFPFFHWLVAEVSFANKKATGATFVVDAGGAVDTTVDTFPGFGELTPQAQFAPDGVTPLPDCDTNPLAESCTTDGLSRTERGAVLTTGFQGFLGQTSVMHFGKTDYLNFAPDNTFVGENGGISGIVYYATTRAEDEPQFAAAEEWEPGVPRVQVNLYADGDIDVFPLDLDPSDGFQTTPGDVDWNGDGVRDLDNNEIDDINGNGLVELADVDNYPLGNFPGLEDVDRNGNGLFDLGDAVQVTWTDSWDDSIPTGCQGQNNVPGVSVIDPPVADNRCFDGLRNFNQIRPGVFDGGYAFADYDLTHLGLVNPGAATAIQAYYTAVETAVGPDVAAKLQLGLIPADYIVEAATPPGYKLVKEEDKNVDFGDEYLPSPAALAATCVGDPRVVPPYLSMTTKDGSGALDQLIPGIAAADAAAPFAGVERPLCDRKKVPLSAAQNAAAEFFLMTDVPVAANVSGVMLNDLANEFNPNSPAFGEKYAPPLLPVAFYDFNGKLVNRVYGDTYGRFNAVLPSTYTANLPQPSGMSPNMLQSCMNDAGPIDDGNGNLIIDPFFDPQYSQFCYTFQYMPGTITYLDTPVVSVAAFTTAGANPVDCERPTNTPMVRLVTRTDDTGPYVQPGEQIRIDSMGRVEVPNPVWDGVNLNQKTILRDYRFGAQTGNVYLEDAAGNRTPLNPANSQWTQGTITADIPLGTPEGDYQVVVVRNNGTESPIGVTLTVDDPAVNGTMNVVRVTPAPYPATPIQDAIDAVDTTDDVDDLILVAPGASDELLIVYKPVRLQGWGAGATFINARQIPTEKLIGWRTKVQQLVSDGFIDLLPGQEVLPGFAALAGAVFPTEEGAGILVAGQAGGSFDRARIDGFTIVGASDGGGIVVSGYSEGLSIGNNRLTANAGTFGGGIRVGHPNLVNQDTVTDELSYTDAMNDGVRIHHNHIAKNGGFGGAGGGISLHTGADGYAVQNNWVCGNFTQGDGAGIGHLGLSDGGLIEDNVVIFNESFTQANAQSGGGVFVGGQPPLVGMAATPGSGSVTIDANLIRGNMAGAGDGGGLRLAAVNGLDVDNNPDNTPPATADDPPAWYQIEVFNNLITNNVAGLAGGGISIQDAILVSIRNNTVANNDSTATTAEAFTPGIPNVTNPQPAGIVSRLHSVDLAFVMTGATIADPDWLTFSDPELIDNIVWQNRSFFWTNYDDPDTAVIETGLVPSTCGTPSDPLSDPTCDGTLVATAEYSHDLEVANGTTETLDPQFSLLTNNALNTAYINLNGNITGDPAFVNGYLNGARDNVNINEFTTLATAAAFDEGGNFIQVTFGPLTLVDYASQQGNTIPLFDYHLDAGSDAINADGVTTVSGRLAKDIDNEVRPAGPGQNPAIDIGADEVQ